MATAAAQHHAPGETHGSFWPLLVAISITLVLVGAVEPLVGVVGIVGLGLAVAGWIREDVHELRLAAPTGRRSDYWFGAAILVVSEFVIFGVLFTYYFWARGYAAAWPPPGIHVPDLLLVGANTVVLLSSGWTAHVAEGALARGDVARFRRFIGATLVLGSAFLLVQAFEYATASFTPQSGTYGTAFFALTGTHGLHVLAGLVVLGILFALARSGFVDQSRATGVSGAILYWHFVDAVWIALFVVLYLRWI